MAHLGHPYEGECVAVIRKHPNVYADISALHYRPFQLYHSLMLVQEYGVWDKVLFGTDYPFTTVHASIDGLRSLNRMLEGTALPRLDDASHRSPNSPRQPATLGAGALTRTARGQPAYFAGCCCALIRRSIAARIGRDLAGIDVLRQVAHGDHLVAVVVQVLHVLLELLARRVDPVVPPSGTPWNCRTAILPSRAWLTAASKSSSVQPGRASPAEGISSG